MIRVNWLRCATTALITVILMLLSVALLVQYERDQDPVRQHIHAANPNIQSNQYFIQRAGIPSYWESIVSNPEPRDSKESDRRNLAAQESISVWTFWMTTAAFLTFFVTSFGTLLIAYQVSLTRKAVRDTSEATEAMRESNRLLKDANDRQLRPYVAIAESDDIDQHPFSRESKLNFRVKNFGQTPARNVRLSIGEAIMAEPIGDFKVPIDEKFGDYGMMAPGDSRHETIYAKYMEVSTIAELAKGKVRFLARLRVDYTWLGGNDFHDITMILNDPSSNEWHLLDDRRRNLEA